MTAFRMRPHKRPPISHTISPLSLLPLYHAFIFLFYTAFVFLSVLNAFSNLTTSTYWLFYHSFYHTFCLTFYRSIILMFYLLLYLLFILSFDLSILYHSLCCSIVLFILWFCLSSYLLIIYLHIVLSIIVMFCLSFDLMIYLVFLSSFPPLYLWISLSVCSGWERAHRTQTQRGIVFWVKCGKQTLVDSPSGCWQADTLPNAAGTWALVLGKPWVMVVVARGLYEIGTWLILGASEVECKFSPHHKVTLGSLSLCLPH